jgi:pyruvate/2-oxoglutarate dehydrogenase complex dihydrolipoamide dehydrogenase (E3) component
MDAAPMTHIEALDLERVPEHLVVLGGGYVGLELAQAMRRFGSADDRGKASACARRALVPFCMFTDPPMGRVGLSETEAKARQVAYRSAELQMSAVLRTRTTSEPRGFMKMLIRRRMG